MDVIEVVEGWTQAGRVSTLAKLLDMSPKTIYKMIDRGSLPHFRLGDSIRLDPKVTARWLRERLG